MSVVVTTSTTREIDLETETTVASTTTSITSYSIITTESIGRDIEVEMETTRITLTPSASSSPTIATSTVREIETTTRAATVTISPTYTIIVAPSATLVAARPSSTYLSASSQLLRQPSSIRKSTFPVGGTRSSSETWAVKNGLIIGIHFRIPLVSEVGGGVSWSQGNTMEGNTERSYCAPENLTVSWDSSSSSDVFGYRCRV
jgi:hypothetical protein